MFNVLHIPKKFLYRLFISKLVDLCGKHLNYSKSNPMCWYCGQYGQEMGYDEQQKRFGKLQLCEKHRS